MTATAQHIETLRQMTTRTEATEYVAKIRGAELTALAREANALGTADQKREMIVRRYVGARLAGAAIRAL
jgi:hypothetical protein